MQRDVGWVYGENSRTRSSARGTVSSSSTEVLVEASMAVAVRDARSEVGSCRPTMRQEEMLVASIARDPESVFLLLNGHLGPSIAFPVIAAAASPRLDIIIAATARWGSRRIIVIRVRSQK